MPCDIHMLYLHFLIDGSLALSSLYERMIASVNVHILIQCFFVSVVSHDSASKECKMRLGEAYALNKKLNGLVSEEDLNELRRKADNESTTLDSVSRKKKQKLID